MTDTPPRWIEYRPVDELPDADRNPKGHADADIEASMDRFGYTSPIEVDERTGKLVGGHGRKGALLRIRERGEPPPEGVLAREDGAWLAPVVRGWASRDDAEVEAYIVANNRLVELGGWLPDPLAAILVEQRDGPGLDGTGYTSDDLDTLLASLVVPDFSPDETEQSRLDQREPITCPECGAKFQHG